MNDNVIYHYMCSTEGTSFQDFLEIWKKLFLISIKLRNNYLSVVVIKGLLPYNCIESLENIEEMFPSYW